MKTVINWPLLGAATKTAINWLLLLAALVITTPSARLDPVMLAVRVLWIVAAGIFFYDARDAMRLTIAQVHQQGVAQRVSSLLQIAAVVMGGYAAVDLG